MHARSELLSLLIAGCVHNILLQTAPDINKAQLQLINAVHMTFIHWLLRNTQHLIVNCI